MPPLQQVLGSALAAMSPPADSVAPRCPWIEPRGSGNTRGGETAMATQRGMARALAQCEAARRPWRRLDNILEGRGRRVEGA